MLISVIMPVYNESIHELIMSINSILNQTYQNFELIIIDDNPSSLKLKHFLNKISSNKKIKILINKRQIGASISSNKAVLNSRGNFIARMDADDICKKTRLNNQLEFLLKNKLDFVCSNFSGFNTDISKADSYYGYNDLTNQNKIKRLLLHLNIAMGPTLLFKKSAFLKIHGYRSILAEDYDLITRFLINDYKVGYQAKSLLYKRNRRNNLSNNNALEEFMITSMISKYMKKYDYSEYPSLQAINRTLRNIQIKDREAFKKFNIDFNRLKDYKSIGYLSKSILDSATSKLLFKRNLSILLTKKFYINKV